MDTRLLGRVCFLAEPGVVAKLREFQSHRQRAFLLFQKIMPVPLANCLERVVYEYSQPKQYASNIRKFYHNLSSQGNLQNQDLSALWLQGALHPETLFKMSNQELFPGRYEGLITDDIRLKNTHVLQDYRLAADGIVKCHRCKSWKTEYTQKQTRSADEPATNFVLCLKCGHRFRFC